MMGFRDLVKRGIKFVLTTVQYAKGHAEPACTLDQADGEYHPQLQKHRELSENQNLEVFINIPHVSKVYFLINLCICEQSFVKIKHSKETTRNPSIHEGLRFFKLLDDYISELLVKKESKLTTENRSQPKKITSNI